MSTSTASGTVLEQALGSSGGLRVRRLGARCVRPKGTSCQGRTPGCSPGSPTAGHSESPTWRRGRRRRVHDDCASAAPRTPRLAHPTPRRLGRRVVWVEATPGARAVHDRNRAAGRKRALNDTHRSVASPREMGHRGEVCLSGMGMTVRVSHRRPLNRMCAKAFEGPISSRCGLVQSAM